MVVQVTGFTAERMLEIESSSVVSGSVDDNGDLILVKHDATTVNAGRVRGAGSESYLNMGNVSGAINVNTALAETTAFTMTNDTAVTLTNGQNGKTAYITAAGAYILTVNGMTIPTGRAVAIMSMGAWDVYIVGSSGDNTAPAAGTLSVTFPGSDGSLSVAGAADYGSGLHAQAYSFSKDNGTTWTAWQSGSTYLFTALTPVTAYTFKHRVRDAVGNISNGLAVTSTTPAAKTWSTLFTDTFASGTVLAGRTVESGTGTFTNDNATAVNITGGAAVYDPTTGVAQYHVAFAATQTRVRLTANYDTSTHTTAGARANIQLGVDTNNTWNNTLYVTIGTVTNGNTADITFNDNALGNWSIAAAPSKALTGHPAAGKIEVDIDLLNGAGTVKVNDVLVANITGDKFDLLGYGARVNFQNSTTKLLDILCERYG